MKMNIVTLIVTLSLGAIAVVTVVVITSTPDKTAIPSATQKAAHDAFVGKAPEASKPYNIMDYTKPAR
jgi:hypothetical protein